MEHFWYLSMLMIWILAVINLSSADRQISFQFEGVDTSFLNRASDACIAIFTVNAPCTPLEDFSLDKDLSLETIEPNGLSQGACFGSLAGLRDSVKEQCGSNATYKAYSDDSIWKASYAMEEALYNVDRTCLREGDGQYCNTWFQVPRKGVPFCDECYKIILWHNAPSLLPGGPISHNCYNKQPNNPPFLIPSPPPTQTCSSMHTLKAGDTFLSLDDYIRAEYESTIEPEEISS